MRRTITAEMATTATSITNFDRPRVFEKNRGGVLIGVAALNHRPLLSGNETMIISGGTFVLLAAR